MHDIQIHIVVSGAVGADAGAFLFKVKAGRILTELQPIVVTGEVTDAQVFPAKPQLEAIVGKYQFAVAEVDGLIVNNLINGCDFAESHGVQVGINTIVSSKG